MSCWILHRNTLNRVFRVFLGHLRHIEVHRVLPVSFNLLIRFRPRVYAISSGNNIIAVYLATLALARLTTELVITFVKPPVVVDFPPIPVDAFNLCTVTVDLQLMLIPNSIGTAFGT